MKKIALSKDGIFYTLQGEGPYVGRPAVFVRVTGCNLRCKFCDTPYTSLPDQLEKGDVRMVEDVAAEIINLLSDHNCNLVVFTGGEPMLQQDALLLIAQIVDGQRAVEFQFETNGTIDPKREWNQNGLNALFVVSPKGAAAGNEALDCNVSWLYVGSNFRRHCKIVYEPGNEKVGQLIDDMVATFGKEHVSIMPEGWLFDHKRYLETAEFCKANGLQMDVRLHTLLWGHTRAT